ncbi:hypothetical protein GCM10009860_18580 [Microbacterium mitrae]|uniref:Integral membrane protein n=1 Tax=Microbacterium mitrae TaxID=664640 RepID=A0A5C8HPX8_9MICO|nr:hypothetical protein [Microbacterium mitrae]TXK04605.1 hypothetical protein FVP60_07980 [Microbacterium mitrae]
MITWFTFTVVAITALAALICIVMGLWGKVPSDLTVGAIALVEVLLLVQVVIAIIAPFAGNPPAGSLLEFWTYLISAVLLPVGGVVWAFVDRTKWSTVIMGVVAIAVAIMMWRMEVIWTVTTPVTGA